MPLNIFLSQKVDFNYLNKNMSFKNLQSVHNDTASPPKNTIKKMSKIINNVSKYL